MKPKTFNNFYTNTSNETAHQVAQEVICGRSLYANPAWFYGPSGTGKSHLMNAIKLANPQAKIMVLSGEIFKEQLIEALRHGELEQFRKTFQEADLLLLEDMDPLREHSAVFSEQELYKIACNMILAGKRVVFTSFAPPDAFLNAALFDRFEFGVQVEMEVPDMTLKKKILTMWAKSDGYTITKDACEVLALFSRCGHDLESNYDEFKALRRPYQGLSDYEIAQTICKEYEQPIVTHIMHLTEKPFRAIASGNKRIELRLYDEKRREIRPGDYIEFQHVEKREETLLVVVDALHVFASFRDLLRMLPTAKLGDVTREDLRRYYPDSTKEGLYGVVGIEISLCETE